MARYFFHVHNGVGLTADEQGRELPDMIRVREEAIKGIRSIVCDEVMKGCIDLRGRIEVVDVAAATIMTVPFEEAFETRRDAPCRAPEVPDRH